MNKTELITLIAENNNCSKVEAEKAINMFTAGVTSAVGAGNDVSLIGFGSFTVNEVAAREGINPATKEPLKIPAYKQVRFKVGSGLKNAAQGSKAQDTKTKAGKASKTSKTDDKDKEKTKAAAGAKGKKA